MTITPPPRTRSLQGPGRDNEPDPFTSLVRQIAGLRQQIDDATAQVLRMAGLRAEPDLLRVLGSLVVEGDPFVPNGSINNDALTSPVSFAGNKAAVNAVIPPSSYGTACTADLTIPTWAQSAVVLAIASIGAISSGSPGGAVTADILIDGAAGDADTLTLAAGASANMTVLAQRVYDPGATTIPVSVSWFAQNAIAGASCRLIAFATVGR